MVDVVELSRCEILAFAVDIDEFIYSVCNISASLSSSLVIPWSIFASSPILILPYVGVVRGGPSVLRGCFVEGLLSVEKFSKSLQHLGEVRSESSSG